MFTIPILFLFTTLKLQILFRWKMWRCFNDKRETCCLRHCGRL